MPFVIGKFKSKNGASVSEEFLPIFAPGVLFELST